MGDKSLPPYWGTGWEVSGLGHGRGFSPLEEPVLIMLKVAEENKEHSFAAWQTCSHADPRADGADYKGEDKGLRETDGVGGAASVQVGCICEESGGLLVRARGWGASGRWDSLHEGARGQG